ncbi:MAG: hypothetical protein ACJ780_14725, partial [Solirubrobacteraceae bacterium]
MSAISLIVAGVIILLKGGELKWRYDRTLRAAEPKPTDSGMDELLRSDLAAVRDRALDRLGVMTEDLEIDDPHDPLGGVVAPESPGDLTPASGLDSRDRQPLVVHGPWDATHTVIANDGRWRFGKYQVMVICPTRHHLAIYVCLLNFLTGGLEGEWTQEYHYVDVVAVGTTTDADEVARLRLIDRTARDRVRFA